MTTVAPGSVVALTATVTAGGTPVTPGQVNFCDATAKFCTDIHLLGTAQLTANGTATLKFRPGVGSYSYKAVLAEPAGLGPTASIASSLTVTASQGTVQVATGTYLEAGGVPNIYSLTVTVLADTLPVVKSGFSLIRFWYPVAPGSGISREISRIHFWNLTTVAAAFTFFSFSLVVVVVIFRSACDPCIECARVGEDVARR